MNDEPESETHLDEIVISATSAQETRLPDSDDDRRLPRPDYDSLEKEQNLNFRERFAFCVQKITIYWLILIASMFLASGIANIQGCMFLSDSVLISMIASTSLGVIIGMISIIRRYLFPRR